MTIIESILQSSLILNILYIHLISLCIHTVPPDNLLVFSLWQGILFVPKLMSRSVSKAFSHRIILTE